MHETDRAAEFAGFKRLPGAYLFNLTREKKNQMITFTNKHSKYAKIIQYSLLSGSFLFTAHWSHLP